MALSSKTLQQQADELQRCAPVLCPNIVPKGLSYCDLEELADKEGEESLDAFRAYAAKAGRGLDRCQLCSRPGALPDYSAEAAGEPPADGESETLRPYAAARISFPDKSMTLGKGWFACGQCRALLHTSRLLHCSALRLGPAHPEREALLGQLCLQFGALNGLPPHITGNADALKVYVQEVYCRAFALQVVASSIRGWRVLGPDGQPLAVGTPGCAARLAAQLLAQPAQPKRPQGSGKAKGPAAASTSAALRGEKQKHGAGDATPGGGSAKAAGSGGLQAAGAAATPKPSSATKPVAAAGSMQKTGQSAGKQSSNVAAGSTPSHKTPMAGKGAGGEAKTPSAGLAGLKTPKSKRAADAQPYQRPTETPASKKKKLQ